MKKLMRKERVNVEEKNGQWVLTDAAHNSYTVTELEHLIFCNCNGRNGKDSLCDIICKNFSFVSRHEAEELVGRFVDDLLAKRLLVRR